MRKIHSKCKLKWSGDGGYCPGGYTRPKPKDKEEEEKKKEFLKEEEFKV